MSATLFPTSSTLLLLLTLIHSTSAQSEANGNDVFGIGASGAGSKNTDSDSDSDSDDDNVTNKDHSTYYLLIILLFFLLLLAVAYIVLARRRRLKAYARRARVVSDMEAQRGQRALVHERQQTGVLGGWGIQMTPLRGPWRGRGREWRGRSRQVEGLNEQGEAPPPYSPKGVGEGGGDKIPGYEDIVERDRQARADEAVRRPEVARTRSSVRGEDVDVASAATAAR